MSGKTILPPWRRALLSLPATLALAFGLPTAPAAAAPPKAMPALRIPVEQYQLGNGLTVLLSPDKRLPVVAVEVRYLVGSAHERPGRSGFAHLFEHLMFQGSKHFNEDYFAPFEPIGGSVNGTTSQDRTNYYERVPSNYLELALWMESDRLFHMLPALTQARLDNQRDVVKNERRQSYENVPYGMSWIYLGKAIFPPGHPYHEPVIGSHADLSAASLDDVKEFFREYYVPANAVLTLVGDFETEPTKRLIEKYFSEGAAGKRTPTPVAQLPKLEASKHLTYTDDVKLPRVYLAWPTPALFQQGDAELDLMSSVLSRGKTSRLYKPLVYEKKVAKEVTAFQASMQLGSFYVVQATAAPGVSLQKLAAELTAALQTALATPPTADELLRAKNGYKKEFYQRLESALSRTSTLATYYQHTGKGDYLPQDLARYESASAADVQRAASEWLPLDKVVRIDIVAGKKSTTGEP
ncbi:MAG: insulinase family protein [Polyangiaceae bacterium]|nr:insulinase family protein [Polyangiaceae bacterium]